MLSAVVLTKNEEKNIARCLQSVAFADEVLVIDDNSTDKTIEVATEFGAKVIKHSLEDFATQRNYGVEQASGDWILFIDADEEVTTKLKEEIIAATTDTIGKSSYYIKRRDIWWGRELKYGEVMTARQKGFIRLHKKNAGTWKGKVHEKFISQTPAGQLQNYLNHFPHQTVQEFLADVNRYSTVRARELEQQGKDVNVGEILLYPFGKFFYTYFIKLGFLDGAAGFAYAFFMSFHSFLVRSKLYQYKYIDK